MKKLIFYILWGCLCPFPAWAGGMTVPLAEIYFLIFLLIVPYILIETAILFWRLHKTGITTKKALVISAWARFYSVVMGIPALSVFLLVLQFIVVTPMIRFICNIAGGCIKEDFLTGHVFAVGVNFSSSNESLIWVYQGIIYYILLVLIEYGIFQRECPNIDKKRLFKLSVSINTLTYLILAATIYIFATY